MIDKFADFVQKRAKIIIIVILLLTGLFLIPLTKIEVDSSLRLFSVESIYEPVERIADLLDLPFETIYVVGKNNESMLSLEALKEQLKIVDFVNSNFDVETTSVVEIIDKELREKKNKSIMEIRSEEELSKAAYSLFEESPEGFKKVAQRMLSKNYNNSYLEDYVFLKVFSRLIPFSGFFISKEVEMPHTELTTIWVFMKNRNASENERKQNAWMIRESVDKLDFNYVRPLYYSYLLIAYDIDQKLAGNTVLLAVIALVSMSVLIFVSFRRLYFVFIPLFIIIVAIIWTFGTAVLLDLKITALHTFIIALLVGIALDGPLHITKRFVEQRKKDYFSHSLKATISSMMPALFLTFITTAAAFSAQIILPTPPALFSFAFVVIIGVTYSFLLVCLLWPALTIVKNQSPVLGSGQKIRRTMNWVFGVSIKYSKAIIVFLIIALLLSIYNTGKIETNVSRDVFVPEGVPSKEVLKIANLYAPYYWTQFILIEGDVLQPEILSALDKLKENIQDNEFFERIDNEVKFESINTLLRQANASNITNLKETYDELYENTAIADPVTKLTFADKAKLILHKKANNYTTILSTIWIKTGKSAEIKQSYDELVKDVEKSGLNNIRGIKIEVTGDVFAAAQTEFFVRKVQIVSSVLMLIFTFLILLLIYRKLSMSIIVSMPILLGSIFSLGLMYLLKIPLTWLNAMVIALVIGLGVDYGIYLTARYKEELKKHDSKEAARIALEQTGEGNLLAAATTILGFVIISFSFLPMAKSFGILTAISIALTFLVTVFLLPALLVRFVKRY